MYFFRSSTIFYLIYNPNPNPRTYLAQIANKFPKVKESILPDFKKVSSY